MLLLWYYNSFCYTRHNNEKYRFTRRRWKWSCWWALIFTWIVFTCSYTDNTCSYTDNTDNTCSYTDNTDNTCSYTDNTDQMNSISPARTLTTLTKWTWFLLTGPFIIVEAQHGWSYPFKKLKLVHYTWGHALSEQIFPKSNGEIPNSCGGWVDILVSSTTDTFFSFDCARPLLDLF